MNYVKYAASPGRKRPFLSDCKTNFAGTEMWLGCIMFRSSRHRPFSPVEHCPRSLEKWSALGETVILLCVNDDFPSACILISGE